MKNAMLVIPIVLCIILLIVPCLELFGLVNGLDFIPNNEIVLVIAQAVLTIGATVALFILKPTYNTIGNIFLSLLSPIAILNALCFADGSWKFSIIFALIWASCSFALYFKFVPDSYLKATSAVFSVLIAIAFVVLYIINLIGNSLTTVSIKDSYPSMHDTYVAEIKLHENKLFGENKMSVDIAKSEPEFKNFIGRFEAKSAEIYTGEEYETKTVIVSWLDDETVIVNDSAYRAVTNEE